MTDEAFPPDAGSTDASGADVLPFPEQSERLAVERSAQLENETFLAIHKFARFTEREMKIINHPAFQRLRDVYQLGQTHLVYASATHKRFEHCLGTVYVAQLMIEATGRNAVLGRSRDTSSAWRVDGRLLTEEEEAFVRLGALLHDIGHLPAGHTIEDELGLVPQHSSEGRLLLILQRTDWNHNRSRPSTSQPDIRDQILSPAPPLCELIDSLYRDDVERAGVDLSPTEMFLELVADERVSRPSDKVPPSFRLQVCRDIIGNTICADLLDYLHRDLHHIGKQKELDERLFEYMQIQYHKEEPKGSAFVIDLRNPDNVRSDGVTAILDLLDTRYYLFEIALYHKTKLCAAAMLERALAELAVLQGADTEAWLSQFVEQLVDCSDATMLDIVAEDAERATPVEDGRQSRAGGALRLALSLRQRRLHKVVYQATKYELPQAQPGHVQRLYAPFENGTGAEESQSHAESLPRHSRNRLDAMRLIEEDFRLSPGSLAMYCAPRKTSTKVAGVNVLFGGDVKTLAKHERESDASLTGGHLASQEERFKGLWRVLVACDPDALNELRRRGLLDVVIGVIKRCVLGLPDPKEDLLLPRLVEGDDPPWPGWQIRRLDDPVGLGDGGKVLTYPTGIPSLREFLDAPS
jgi:HD superfamily phosphohydrolase